MKKILVIVLFLIILVSCIDKDETTLNKDETTLNKDETTLNKENITVSDKRDTSIVKKNQNFELREVQVELIKTFPINKGENSISYPVQYSEAEESELGYGSGTGSIGWYLNLFFRNENLVIQDSLKERTLYLDDDFEIQKIIKKEEFKKIPNYGSDEFYFEIFNEYERGYIAQYDKNGNLIRTIGTESLGFQGITNLLSFDNTLFIWGDSLQIVSISNFSQDKNLENLNYKEDTISLVKTIKKNNNKWDIIEIDDNGRLFLEGKLYANRYSDFYLYWKTLLPEKFKENEIKAKRYNSNYRLLGYDSEDKQYWFSSGRTITIINNDHYRYIFRITNLEKCDVATMNNKGEVYLLKYDTEEAKLYKLIYKY